MDEATHPSPMGAIPRDTHRYRIGPNYAQLPPNRARSQVNGYAKDGPMRYEPSRAGAPYAPNSHGGPPAAVEGFGDPTGWRTAGEMVREAYRPHSEDDDWGQAGTQVRQVLDDAARERLVSDIAGHLKDGVSGSVLERACRASGRRRGFKDRLSAPRRRFGPPP